MNLEFTIRLYETKESKRTIKKEKIDFGIDRLIDMRYDDYRKRCDKCTKHFRKLSMIWHIL